MTDTSPTRRQSRFWLYGPVTLLAILAAAWSGFWFYAHGRVVGEPERSGMARERREIACDQALFAR